MNLPEKQAYEIWRRLHEAGFETYWAGGCVRDRLLGIEPQDYDLATAARPEDVLRLFPHSEAVGRAFGVVLVKRDGLACEVASFRKDGPYSDGRRPDWVEYSDAASDVRRRDFTINGLLYDPGRGEVLDMVGGRADLAAGVVRCIGDAKERFSEDYLRLMRCVRFAARFNFTIEESTYNALKRLSQRINRVAVERISDELTRIITGPQRERGLRLLLDSGLLKEILPEVYDLHGLEQSPDHHPEGDVFEHTCRTLAELHQPDEVLAYAALLHDIGKKATQVFAPDRIRFHGHAEKGADLAHAVCRRLRLGTARTELIASLVQNHMRFKEYPHMRRATRLRFFNLPAFEKLLELHRADRAASSHNMETYEAILADYRALSREELEPPPLLNGHDLLEMGFTAGRRIGQILEAVRDGQFEGQLQTHDEAVSFVEQNFRK